MNDNKKIIGFELSYNQKLIWSSANLHNYYNQAELVISGTLDRNRLAGSIAATIKKHEILSSKCYITDSSVFPAQAVHTGNAADFYENNGSGKKRDEIIELANTWLNRSYDPATDEPVRFYLVKCSDEEYLLFIRLYSLWSDCYSCHLFVKELFNEYHAIAAGDEHADLIEYKNFSQWQNNLLQEPDEEAQHFWKNYKGIIKDKLLPFEKNNRSAFSPKRMLITNIEGEAYYRLISFCTSSDVTPSCLLLNVFGHYLNEFSEHEVIVGYTDFKRQYEELAATIGLVNRTLPVKFSSKTADLMVTRQQIADVSAWSDYFHFDYFNNPGQASFSYEFGFADLSESKHRHENTLFQLNDVYSVTGSFSLKLFCTDNGECFRIELYYDDSRFSEQDVKIMISQLQLRLENYSGNSSVTSELTAEEHKIIERANNTKTGFDPVKTVITLFEEQAEKYPESTALSFEDDRISYKELHERSNILANILRKEHAINCGDNVAIMLDRSPQLIIAILAVLKCGAAYIPVDPSYPAERIGFILNDSVAKLLISERLLTEKFALNVGMLDINTVSAFASEEYKKPLTVKPQSSHLAYIIYTSGSTGNPKGCMISHKNLSNYIQWANEYYFKAADHGNWGCITSVSFDLTLTSIFTSLTRGKLLLLGNPEKETTDLLQECFTHTGIDTLKLTPAHLSLLKGLNISNTPIRIIISGGEQLTKEQVNAVWDLNKEIRIYNEYGPTEATVGSVVMEVKNGDDKILIGKPVGNTEIVILDPLMRMCPIGVGGEICIGGHGLSAGYLNRAALSEKKFVLNPHDGKRIYKTGDLGRWLPDGNIEYLGRKDDQVKIRGYRIELGEIENALRQLEQVDEAVAALWLNHNNEKELVAYVISSQQLNIQMLRSELKHLPAYMIPSYFVQIDKMPLSPNGKINKKALPDPANALMNTGTGYVAPAGEKEKKLAHIWGEVLGREKEKISAKDNFFALGGDSIKSIQIVSRISQLGYSIRVADIFNTPVLRDLSKKLLKRSREIDQSPVIGKILLTPIQKQFFNHYGPAHHYNQSVLLDIRDEITEEGIKKCFEVLVLHHDILRANYRLENNEWQQIINSGKENLYHFESFDLADNEQDALSEICREAQEGFNLADGPLANIRLIRMPSGSKLLIVIHHLVVDGISWRILLEDLATLFTQYKQERLLKLPLKTDSFQYWALRLNEYAPSPRLLKEKKYWEEIAGIKLPPFKMDHSGGSNLYKDENTVSFTVNPELTELLLTAATIPYTATINDILLAALGYAIKNTLNVDKFLVGMEGHGREEIVPDVNITRTVGWFTSFYPVVVAGDNSLIGSLVGVKDNLRRIQDKGIGYGILKHLDNSLQAELSYSVVFNYLGDFGSGVKDSTSGETAFTYSSAERGMEISENYERQQLLDVSAIRVNNEMTISITYSKHQYEHSTITSLSNSYEKSLKELIFQLSEMKSVNLTAGDLSFKGLTNEEFSLLNANDDVEDVYELSPLQQGMFYHWMADPSPLLYFEQTAYTLKGKFDADALRKAYQQLVERHAALRTFFVNEYAGTSLQVIKKTLSCEAGYTDLSGYSQEERSRYASGFKLADRRKGFNLEEGSQMRLSVLNLGNNYYEFIWSFHHILMDGWCVSILINDFFKLYESVLTGKPAELPLVVPYADYLDWLDKNDGGASISYWKEYLQGYSQKAVIPFTKKTNAGSEYIHRCEQVHIEGSNFEALRQLCKELDITENIFLQAVWGYLLSKYNNTHDVVFGAVVSGRPAELESAETIVGLFSNTIPVRFKIEQSSTVRDVLRKHKGNAIESMAHHYVNLALVQAQSDAGKELIDHIMIFENYLTAETDLSVLKDLNASDGEQPEVLSSDTHEQTNYNFNIVVLPDNNGLTIDLRYNENYYDSAGLALLAGHLNNVIQYFIQHPGKQLSACDYLTEKEKNNILNDFNPGIEMHADKTIIGLFEAHLKNTPDKTAIKFNDVELTYAEVDSISTQLGNYLKNQYSIQADDRVGIKLLRNEWMILAVLGVLKSGGAYVPIDPEFPEERIGYIVQDSGCRLIIDDEEILRFKEMAAAGKVFASRTSVQPSDLAYVIYTSGSTGKPKGVMVEHRNVADLIESIAAIVEPVKTESVSFSTNLTFDISVFEVLGTLCLGKTLIIFDEKELSSPVNFIEKLLREKVNLLQITPSRLSQIEEQIDALSTCIKVLMVGGEAMPKKQYDLLKKKNAVKRINAYGPTETTVWSTALCLDTSEQLTIGRPLKQEYVYIMDTDGYLSPVGVAGEICIGGKGVARGYLNLPELTAEKFIPDPFKPGKRIYKTGDLGRWLADGTIEFLGRKDHQVKVRGYRIELEEIEAVMAGHPSIEGVAVIIKKNKEEQQEIVAYLTSKEEINAAALSEYLAKYLPWYMLPSHYKIIGEFPLTASGKINRKTLNDIHSEDLSLGTEYVAPANLIEERLVEIWKEVLAKEKIGTKDNFFLLGGHSLNVMQLIAKINKAFNCKITIESVFDSPTVSEIAEEIARVRVVMNTEDEKQTGEHVKITI